MESGHSSKTESGISHEMERHNSSLNTLSGVGAGAAQTYMPPSWELPQYCAYNESNDPILEETSQVNCDATAAFRYLQLVLQVTARVPLCRCFSSVVSQP